MSDQQSYIRGGQIRAEASPFAPANLVQLASNADLGLGSDDYYPPPHHPFIPPTPEQGSVDFNVGGVKLSPIKEHHDPEKTPRAADFHFRAHFGLDGHKRVVSDTGSPLQYNGHPSESQRPRSQSDANLASQFPSFDYQEPRIWNGHSEYQADDQGVNQSFSTSSSPDGKYPTEVPDASSVHQKSSSDSSLVTGNGMLELPSSSSNDTWQLVPNELTPTKPRNVYAFQQHGASLEPSIAPKAAPRDMTPWRIPQRREPSNRDPQSGRSNPSYEGNEVVRIMNGMAGLKITTSPVGSSTHRSNGSSDSPSKPDIRPMISTDGIPASYQPGEEKQRKAREFAAMIKAGMLDNRNSSRNSSGFSDGSAIMPTPPQFYQQMHPIPAAGQVIPPQIDALVAYFRSNNGASYEEMVNNMPLEDKCLMHTPVQSGVVHISDIPYSTTRQEIVAFFGRNARFVHQPANSPHYAIHIIMERSTGKSMDCYVEFQTPEDAAIAAQRFNKHSRGPGTGRGPRLGNRSVRVEVVDQSVMMKEIFPRAKYVEWHGGSPIITTPPNQDGFISSGFQGFVTSEEMHMTVKLSADPKRSKYTSNHVQRTYESMISLMSKYPWHATQCYTLGERDLIFRSTLSVIGELVNQVQRGHSSEVLSPQLLAELLLVAHNCPGFSDNQRAQIVDRSCHLTGAPPVPLTIMAAVSPFRRLTKKHGVSDELMNYMAQLLGQAPANVHPSTVAYNLQQAFSSPFGGFQVFPPGFDASAMTMFDAGNCEWAAMDGILQNSLHHAQS